MARLTLDTLERDDEKGALRVARDLARAGRLGPEACEVLFMMQTNPSARFMDRLSRIAAAQPGGQPKPGTL